MPKPSLNPEKAKQGGGVEAGNYEVTAAKIQNVKSDFKELQPTLILTSAVLDKDGDRVRGADSVDILLGFGKTALEAFHPGQAKSAEEEPKDMGTGVDVEGNTIYCAQEGEQFNKSCGAIVFSETLVKAGFPKTELDKCWAPSYVGLKFFLEVKTSKEINDKYGTRLSTRPTNDGNTITYKVCSKWLNPNYLSQLSASKEASAAPINGKAEMSVEETAMAVLATVATRKAGEKNAVKTKAALVGFFTSEYAKAKYNPKNLTEAQNLVKDDNWLAGAVAELDGTVEESGRIVFPEPAAAVS